MTMRSAARWLAAVARARAALAPKASTAMVVVA
jgi:hypothetical protein